MHWVLPMTGPVSQSAATWLVRGFFDRAATFSFVDAGAGAWGDLGAVGGGDSPLGDPEPDAPKPPGLTRAEREARDLAWFWLR